MIDTYTTAVKEAHEVQRRKQKLHYDERQYDVDFKVGDNVLWHGPRRKNKLEFQWHGPFVITSKVSDVKYIVKDPLDGKTRPVSVSQIVPVLGEFDIMDGAEDVLEPLAELQSLKVGHYIIFKRHDDERLRDVHVAEIVGAYDALDRSITVHHLIDLGPKDTSRWKKDKPLSKRRVFHEYRDNHGCSNTLKCGKRKAKIDEYALSGVYKADKIVIICKNFVMHGKGKIPPDVCLRAENWFKAQECRSDQIDLPVVLGDSDAGDSINQTGEEL